MSIEQRFFNLSFRINDMNAITYIVIHWSISTEIEYFNRKSKSQMPRTVKVDMANVIYVKSKKCAQTAKISTWYKFNLNRHNQEWLQNMNCTHRPPLAGNEPAP